MKKLILATNNKHKIFEIADMLRGIEVRILSSSDFDDFPDVEETGDTLEKNAVLKATAIREKYGLPCLADDTGLEVLHLDGAPGVYSARFAGPGCTYDDNNRKLMRLLEDVERDNRSAVFKTVIAFADEAGKIHVVEGTLKGQITFQPRGKRGFGYDPVFEVDGQTLAEMTPQEKNRISHRGIALRKIKPILLEAFSDAGN